MLPALGDMALAGATCVCVLQILFAVQAARAPERNPAAPALLNAMVSSHLLLIFVAYCAMSILFVQDAFEVVFVAQNSHVELPLAYKLSAVWGGHEGSLLLWMLMLAGWTWCVGRFSNNLPTSTRAIVLGVLGFVAIGFLTFTLWTSNPFDLQFPVPESGRDLNPLLQDPGMVIHPPLLYMGYVGFAVAFAFAVAALIEGRLDSTWARWTRPWTTSAWAFLTAGIALGSWWAYHELGWGGWWFWDPVENASFMPWLVGTALIHSLAVTDKRGVFKSWTVLLAIVAFGLSLLGTFLVRSGVLVSVHAFASDPERGLYILAFLTVVVGGALALYAWRASQLKPETRVAIISRESALLLNNVFLVVLAAVVFIGTLYPLVVDSLGLGSMSVGPPYFEALFIPLGLPLVLLVGFSATLAWKRSKTGPVLRAAALPAAVAVVAGIALWAGIYAARGAMALVGIVLGLWAIFAALRDLWLRARSGRGVGSIPSSLWGMSLGHLGLGMFVIAVTVVSSFDVERDVRLATGEVADVEGYQFRFEGTRPVEGPNYIAERATVTVLENGAPIATLYPEKRRYRVQQDIMTQSAVSYNPMRDLYVSLGEPMGSDAWSLRLQYKPMMRLVWLGTALMMLGGFIAALDRRYWRATRSANATASGATAQQVS